MKNIFNGKGDTEMQFFVAQGLSQRPVHASGSGIAGYLAAVDAEMPKAAPV